MAREGRNTAPLPHSLAEEPLKGKGTEKGRVGNKQQIITSGVEADRDHSRMKRGGAFLEV